MESLDIYEKSNNDIALELGVNFKNYRIALGLTQKDISEQSGVSIMTIVRFEKGAACSIRLDNLIALMRAIQKLSNIAQLIPSIPDSLYKVSNAERKRVRKAQ